MMFPLLPPETEELDIFIEIPITIAEETNDLNQKIANELIDKDNVKSIAHITLYQGKFRREDLQFLIQELQKIAAETSPIEIQMQSHLFQRPKHLWWNVENNSQLQQLHEKVLAIAMKTRVGLRQTHLDQEKNFSETQKEYLKKYGTFDVANDFKPHITVFYGSGNDPRIAKIIETIKPNESSLKFSATSIAIGKIDMQGNLLEVISESKMQLEVAQHHHVTQLQ